MTTLINYHDLVPVEDMAGEDDEETAQLRKSLEEARSYIRNHQWCHAIKRELLGLGVGGVVSVFLFELMCAPGVDDVLWVVSGDLPAAYLVTDAAPTPAAALEVYCGLMEDWIKTVQQEGDMSRAFPVLVDPTRENAEQLEKRISFLRREVIPLFQHG